MKFTTGDTVVTFDKLWYLQRAHADRFASSDVGTDTTKLSLLTIPIIGVLKRRNLVNEEGLVLNHHKVDDYLPKLLRADARNYTNAPAFVERNKYFFEAPDRADLLQCQPSLSLQGIPAGLRNPISTETLGTVLSLLRNITSNDWTAGYLRKFINDDIIRAKTVTTLHDFIDSDGVDHDMTRNRVTKAWSKLIHKYIRWAIAAGLPGPDGAESMEILGREETVARLAVAAEVLASLRINDIEAEGVEEGKAQSSV
jgi:glutamyl-tRNA synthetase